MRSFPPELAAALPVAMVTVMWAPAEVLAQISPGPLTRPHADLEGSDGCLQCHAPGRGVDPQLCLTCHQPLNQRLAAGRGLHAAEGYEECARCHVEHHGRDFELVWWGDEGRESFDHALTGYLLTGGHVEPGCRTCHQTANVVHGDELRRWNKDLGRTFLGLDQRCDSCHLDQHRGQFEAARCDSCHTEAAWAPAEFDHDSSRFPLQGAHLDVACALCHAVTSAPPAVDRRGRAIAPVVVRYRNGRLECEACHLDEHRAQFPGRGCDSCHTEVAWAPARRFGHDRTRYPLTGRHREVACDDCHGLEAAAALASGDAAFHRYRPVAFGRCDDCHVDEHDGRMAGGCSDCHSTAGWDQHDDATFDHALTRYALEGRHRQVACEQCHQPGTGYRVERFARCDDCHADAHYGQLEVVAGRDCSACHDLEGFTPSEFTVDDHASISYPLSGAHLQVACGNCHVSRPVGHLEADGLLRAAHDALVRDADVLTVQLRFAGFDCDTCHVDPHGSTTAQGAAIGCESCHGTVSWSGVGFDHALTGYVLDGAHAAAPCLACHESAARPSIATAGGPPATPTAAERSALRVVSDSRNLSFSGLETSCQSCHTDTHRGQFAAAQAVVACRQCHATTAWVPSDFDHAETRFPLEGGHAGVDCEACHQLEHDALGSFARYRPTALDCEACHGSAGGPR